MAFKEKHRWKFERKPRPTSEEVIRARLQNLDELQGWREAEGAEKIYIQRCLLYEAEDHKGTGKYSILMALFGVLMLGLVIDAFPIIFDSAIWSRDFWGAIQLIVCGILMAGLSIFAISLSISSNPWKESNEFADAIREGAFRVVDVKVSETRNASSSPGSSLKVEDMYGKHYDEWIRTYHIFDKREYAILIQVLKDWTLPSNTHVLPRYDPESKYCKKCMVEYADYY